MGSIGAGKRKFFHPDDHRAATAELQQPLPNALGIPTSSPNPPWTKPQAWLPEQTAS